MAALPAFAYILAASVISSFLTPVSRSNLSGVKSFTASFRYSKPSAYFSINSLSCKFSEMMTFIIVFSVLMFEPTGICKNISAFLAISVRFGSTTIIFAPRSKPLCICIAMIGWHSLVFVPISKNTSVSVANSTRSFVIVPFPRVLARPATVGACQRRAQ